MTDFSGLSDEELGDHYHHIAERVAKWRSVFAGWQLGTRASTDPESAAVRDARELLIMLRAEVNALTILLQEVGVITARNYTEHLATELLLLDESFRAMFPGFEATPTGIKMTMPEAADTVRKMHFPP